MPAESKRGDAWERHGLNRRQRDMVKRAVEAFRAVLGDNIRRSGHTESALSTGIGLGRGTVGNWARPSATALPNVRELFLLAHELSVEPATLLRGISLAVLRGEEPIVTPKLAETEPEHPNGALDAMASRLADRLMEKVGDRALEIVEERLS